MSCSAMVSSLIVVAVIFAQEKEWEKLKRVPANRRTTFVIELCDKVQGPDAGSEYAAAIRSFVKVFDSQGRPIVDLLDDPEVNRVDDNQHTFALVDHWLARDRVIIDKWLSANEKALGHLKAATSRPRYNRLATMKPNRLSGDDGPADFLRLARLMELRANSEALKGDTNEAFDWNMRLHDMADQLYQNPLGVDQLIAMGIERSATQQTLSFLERGVINDLEKLKQRVNSGNAQRCEIKQQVKANLLSLYDQLEAWYEWGKIPDLHPSLTKMAEFLVTAEDSIASLVATSRPDTIEWLRRQLARSSADHEWRVYLQIHEEEERWYMVPYHQAWKHSADFNESVKDVLKTCPVLSCFIGGTLTGSSQSRFVEETTGMHGSALRTIIGILAYENMNSQLPRQLDDLIPGYLEELPTDSFSGRPLIYRTRGKEFTLYSVSGNQTDDDGRHTSSWHENGDFVFWPPPPPVFVNLRRPAR